MTELARHTLIRALLKQPVDYTPIWIMRQAGRYLPEYKATRAKAGDFITLCQTPELACEVTLQPLERFPLDAAILFSDILTIPDAMGLGLYFAENEGPKFERTIQSEKDVDQLPIPDPEGELKYVNDAVRLIRKELNERVPLIGFSGSPWTLATYMVEGGSTKNFSKIKAMMYSQPQILNKLLQKLAESVVQYINAQIAAGAQAVMIFDTWGGVLPPPFYEAFSLHYMKYIVDNYTRNLNGEEIPIVLFTKGGGLWLEKIADSGCHGMGIDWTIDIADAKARVGSKVALQGNLDPAALYAQPEDIRKMAQGIIDGFGKETGHVFNLGHGIYPNVPPEHVGVLVDAVHELSKR